MTSMQESAVESLNCTFLSITQIWASCTSRLWLVVSTIRPQKIGLRRDRQRRDRDAQDDAQEFSAVAREHPQCQAGPENAANLAP